jgi:glycerol-3-phosphate O-acyltransferase/dihydroxyacetone phosphate acyltransferase
MGLLPLKAGICIMALGAMDKYDISVKIVPCGFHYFNPQNFRSKAIM